MIRNPFARRAPITIVPPGYQVELNRLPPRENRGCLRIAGLTALAIAVLALTGFVILRFISGNQPQQESVNIEITLSPTYIPTFTSSPSATSTTAYTATLDGWSLTGTAFAVATATMTSTYTASPDYCWFLTPSPTPSNTPIRVTPDQWQLTGTAVRLQTGTPSPTPTETRPSPRAWCDLQTPTLTPFPLLGGGVRAETTVEVGDWQYLESPTLAPTATRTLLPPIRLSTSVPPAPTSIPPYMPPTAIPVLPTNPPPISIVTIAPPPTATFTYTLTATFTPTETPSATATLTSTATYTPTDLPTATPTDPPTETFTPSLTFTPTETPSLTPTFTPTQPPALFVVAATCQDHYPSFAVQNLGNALQLALWEIRLGDLIAANGVWQYPADLGTGAFANASAPAWAGVPGLYTLIIYQTWDPVFPYLTAFVSCDAPTATFTHTPTETVTSTPTPTATETSTEAAQ